MLRQQYLTKLNGDPSPLYSDYNNFNAVVVVDYHNEKNVVTFVSHDMPLDESNYNSFTPRLSRLHPVSVERSLAHTVSVYIVEKFNKKRYVIVRGVVVSRRTVLITIDEMQISRIFFPRKIYVCNDRNDPVKNIRAIRASILPSTYRKCTGEGHYDSLIESRIAILHLEEDIDVEPLSLYSVVYNSGPHHQEIDDTILHAYPNLEPNTYDGFDLVVSDEIGATTKWKNGAPLLVEDDDGKLYIVALYRHYERLHYYRSRHNCFRFTNVYDTIVKWVEFMISEQDVQLPKIEKKKTCNIS